MRADANDRRPLSDDRQPALDWEQQQGHRGGDCEGEDEGAEDDEGEDADDPQHPQEGEEDALAPPHE